MTASDEELFNEELFIEPRVLVGSQLWKICNWISSKSCSLQEKAIRTLNSEETLAPSGEPFQMDLKS